MVSRGIAGSQAADVKIWMVAVGDPMTVLAQLNSAINRTAKNSSKAIANAIVRRAKQLAPRDTGYLQSSIRAYSVDNRTWGVTVDADYGVFVEYGTSRTPEQAFMRPAIEEVNATGLMAEAVWNDKGLETAMHTPVIRELGARGTLANVGISTGAALLTGIL